MACQVRRRLLLEDNSRGHGFEPEDKNESSPSHTEVCGCAVLAGVLCCRQGAFGAGSGAFSVGLHAGSLVAGLLADLDLAADGLSFGLPTAGSFGFSAGLTAAACFGGW